MTTTIPRREVLLACAARQIRMRGHCTIASIADEMGWLGATTGDEVRALRRDGLWRWEQFRHPRTSQLGWGEMPDREAPRRDDPSPDAIEAALRALRVRPHPHQRQSPRVAPPPTPPPVRRRGPLLPRPERMAMILCSNRVWEAEES